MTSYDQPPRLLGRLDPTKEIGPPAPHAVRECSLRDDLRARPHRFERLRNRGRTDPDTFNLHDLVTAGTQVLEIAALVDRTSLDQKLEEWIVESRRLERAVDHAQVQIGQVAAMQMTDEVGGAELESSAMLDHERWLTVAYLRFIPLR